MTAKNVLRRLWLTLAYVVLAAAALAATGCPSDGAPKVANVQPGEMPQGADWTGVYYSELYGFLHLVQDGQTVSGKWLRPSKDRWGSVNGKANGDLIKFSWSEYTVGSVGPNSMKKGRGFFKYKRPAGDNVDDTIVGEIGFENDETGEPWDAVKQRNVQPDLKSIGGTGAGDIGGGDWDSENKEKGNPEAPKPPAP
jgi:hypothetical protein